MIAIAIEPLTDVSEVLEELYHLWARRNKKNKCDYIVIDALTPLDSYMNSYFPPGNETTYSRLNEYAKALESLCLQSQEVKLNYINRVKSQFLQDAAEKGIESVLILIKGPFTEPEFNSLIQKEKCVPLLCFTNQAAREEMFQMVFGEKYSEEKTAHCSIMDYLFGMEANHCYNYSEFDIHETKHAYINLEGDVYEDCVKLALDLFKK